MTRNTYLAHVVLAVLSLASCNSRSQYEKDMDAIHERFQADMRKIARDATADAEKQNREWQASKGPAPHGLAACKAAVGMVMGRSPAGMSGRALDGNRFQVAYRRSDGTRWTYRCLVTTNRVRWATLEDGAEGPTRAGENIRYVVTGRELRLTSDGMDGKERIDRYTFPGLRPLGS